MIPPAAQPLLLDLHLATQIACQRLRRADRARLEKAVRDVVLAAKVGAIALEPATQDVILARLRALLSLARETGADWPTVVGIVNREG